MIKLAYFISNLSYGGAQTMLVRLIKSIDRSKFDVVVFVRDSREPSHLEDELTDIGVKCVYLDINEGKPHKNKIAHKIKSYRRLKKAINQYSPDIVHTHLELYYTLAYALFNNKKTIATIHSQPDRIVSPVLNFLIKKLEKKKLLTVVGCAQCVTDNSKKLLKSQTACTLYNPINLSDYSVKESDGNNFTYIHVARLNPIKNQALLMDAFKGVLEEFPHSKLMIVGDGSLMPRLKEQCDSLGIADSVDFLGNRSDVPQLLSSADAFVLSSDSECCPVTVLEAIASGLPVVSTDVGGVGEIAGDAGILVEKGNADRLKEAMIEVQLNKEKYNAMSASALKNSKKFDSSYIAKQHEELYIKFNDGE